MHSVSCLPPTPSVPNLVIAGVPVGIPTGTLKGVNGTRVGYDRCTDNQEVMIALGDPEDVLSRRM
jgi:hypothetical protein